MSLQMSKKKIDKQKLAGRILAGILAGISKQTHSLQHLQEVIHADIPLVLYDRPCPSLPCDQVVSDDYMGAFKAVEYLIQTGCQRIMFFSSPMQLEVAHRRYQGWRDALQRYRMPIDDSMIVTCDSRAQAIIETPMILKRADKPERKRIVVQKTIGNGQSCDRSLLTWYGNGQRNSERSWM